MNAFKRAISVSVLVLFVSISGPGLHAGPKGDGDVRIPPRIAKIVKQLQKLFGITINEDQPLPPRP